jgi:L-ascorbate metabolism protein UlaG (beta-lactamase superfamily)
MVRIQKLAWAGIVVESNGERLLIDPITGISSAAEKVFGAPREPMFPLDQIGNVLAVLQTHTHQDHFDPKALLQAYGNNISVLVPHESVSDAVKEGLEQVIGVHLGDTLSFGPFSVTATYSADGFGSPQVAWVIEAEGRKILHAGDTLWHGHWWKIAKLFGTFDAALLPVNAARIVIPGQKPSEQPISMSPEQAVSAADILDASVLIPIHFRTFHQPPTYIETPQVLERLEDAARQHSRKIKVLDPLQWLEIE